MHKPSCSLIFFTTVIFFAVINQGTSLKCYVCKSGRDEPCGYPTPTNGVSIMQCVNPGDICYHADANIKADKGYPQYVQRSCIPGAPSVINCPAEGSHNACSVCDKDLCNNNPTTLEPASQSNDDGNNDQTGDDTSNEKDDGGNSGIRNASSPIMSVFVITCWLLKLYGKI